MDADRQLPLAGEIFLDHVAHWVPDSRAAADAMVRAGFAPTPVSIQTNPGPNGTSVPAGTGNVTAMLTRGYIEVLFKTSETPLTREFDAGVARYPGLHLIAFAVADARAASERLTAAGFRTAPIVALRRPVATQTGEAEAAFTVARVPPGEMAEGRIQYLTHHTEDTVWQKRWLAHPNGAKALVDVIVVVGDVDEAAARYARFTGRQPVATGMGRSLLLDRGGVQLMDRTGFSRLVPAVPIPNLPFIGAYAVRVDSIIGAANGLRARGLNFEQRDNMLFVPFPPALGTGAWIFVEQLTDLPWRAKS
ncbi:MAG TPA: VOC family protein [Micropepsaceae bacterium]|nr:VOC family protein [Micropepsaceae bacterium]